MADYLVPGDYRPLGRRQFALNDVEISTADSAGFNSDTDLIGSRFWKGKFRQC
jgi:hypothetical protein